MAENPPALREYFTPNTYNSPIEKSLLFPNKIMNNFMRVGRDLKNFFVLALIMKSLNGNERNRQMVDSSCGGTFLHKTADEAWDLFENLSDNSQQHATSSRVGTSRQIGNRGMFKSMTQILDSHTQSIAKLETQIGQLAMQ
ncbi:hypothetical protein M9H77_07532 [Catharanthus roseus]|uniref:Uncharacterized protein n=1 Tax=Catharanthus roseus TaxID=4058 RepID=A0ACC0BV69_CATRO|nr:hypothetical protein M9H77_07532 [Catharanthus roseus]